MTDQIVRKVFPFCNILGQERKGGNKVRSTCEKKVSRPNPVILGKLSPVAVVCFRSWKSLFSGHHLVCMSSQGLVLPLDVTHGSKSLFLGV